MPAYKAKPNELNKRGDRRGKRGKDKGGKREIFKAKYTDESIAYWNETLDLVEQQLLEYLKTDKVREFIINGSGGNPPVLTPKELITKGIGYFRFMLKHRRNMTVYGLALHLGTSTMTFMRMEQRNVTEAYKNDIYKPIIQALKSLVGLFHEEMGTDKINPNFHIFVLKALRSGFEEMVDLNVNTPSGLSEEEREKLRSQVSGFTENFTKKPSQDQNQEWRKH